MKEIINKIRMLSFIIFILLAWQNSAAQCKNCDPSGLLNTTPYSAPAYAPSWTVVNTNTMRGRQYMQFNVVKGQVYRWSTQSIEENEFGTPGEDYVLGVPGKYCSSDAECSGGYLCVGPDGAKRCAVQCNTDADCVSLSAASEDLRCVGLIGQKRCELGFDTELTVLKNACGEGGTTVAYNKNYYQNQSEVEWKADETTTVFVLVTSYQCKDSATNYCKKRSDGLLDYTKKCSSNADCCGQSNPTCTGHPTYSECGETYFETSLKWQRADSDHCSECKENSGMIIFRESVKTTMKYGLFSYGPSTGNEYEATVYRGPVTANVGDTTGFTEYSLLTYGTTGLENVGYLVNKDASNLNIVQHGAELAVGNKVRQLSVEKTVASLDADSRRNISMLYYTMPILTGYKFKQGTQTGTVASVLKTGVHTPSSSSWTHTSYDFHKAGDYQVFNVQKGSVYRWSTCNDESFDTQLTLFRGKAGKKCTVSGTVCSSDSNCPSGESCESHCGDQFLAYADDTDYSPCGTGSKQTVLEWHSDFTGQVSLLVNQFNCGFCYQSPEYYSPWTHCPRMTVMMQKYDCNGCGTQNGATRNFTDAVETQSGLVPGNYMKFNLEKGTRYLWKSTEAETGSTFSAILTLRKDNTTKCTGETLAQSKLVDGSTYQRFIDFYATENMVVELLVSRSDTECSSVSNSKTATVTYEKINEEDVNSGADFEDDFKDDNGDTWTNVTRTSDGMVIYDNNVYKDTWAEAMQYCEDLVYTIPSTSTDVDDWVLPNINDLYEIVDFGLYDKATSFRLPSYVTNTAGEGGACTLDTQETACNTGLGYPQYICGDELKCVRNNWYWTSTSVADSANFSWGINMKDGRSYRVLKNDYSGVPATRHKVICIRGDSVSGQFDPVRPAVERKFSGWACDKNKPTEEVTIYFVIRDKNGNIVPKYEKLKPQKCEGDAEPLPNISGWFGGVCGFKYGKTNKLPSETTKQPADITIMENAINANCSGTAATVEHAFELDITETTGVAQSIKDTINDQHADPVYTVTAWATNAEKLSFKIRVSALKPENEKFVYTDVCGDGTVSGSEGCDDFNAVTEECPYNTPCNVCDATCQWASGYVPECGDGNIDAGFEDCDCLGSYNWYIFGDCSQGLSSKRCPGYSDGTDTCTICNEICKAEILTVPYCGDGTKDDFGTPPEECDDGNASNNDGCVENCKLAYCGDGFINIGPESCDDGVNNGSYATVCNPGPCCNTTCSGDGPMCGDGVLHREDCPGAVDYNDPGVWNGKPCIKILGANETCDAGTDNGVWKDLAGHISDPGCNATCSGDAPYCGDGNLDAGYEICDDGASNVADTYGLCDTQCGMKPNCGDGDLQREDCPGAATWGDSGLWNGIPCVKIHDANEKCDEGIYNGQYGSCNSSCNGILECGDGVWTALYEECEHGGNPMPYSPKEEDSCNNDCTIGRFCGDGFLDNAKNVPLNNWKDPGAWSNNVGMTWDSSLEALKIVSYYETVLNVPIPIDTSKQYYLEYDVMTKNNSGKVLYSGTISYDSAMTQLDGHPGSYDYFVDSANTFTANTWYHRRNTFIGGQPRTGESATQSERNRWHPGTAYAKVMFLFNYSGISTQETYIKNLKFYTIEDGVTGLGDGELCDHGTSNVNKDFATGYMVDCIATGSTTPDEIACKWAHYCGDGLVDGPGGDGFLTGPEACDDGPLGNIGEYDKCAAGCLEIGPHCGDGIVNGTEQCDAGMLNSNDPGDPGVTCRTNCKWAKCGDNIQDTGEECDNGTANSNTTPNACRTNCTVSKCGDGITDSGEECDDGDLGVSGVRAKYTFDETSLATAEDTSGNVFNGSIVGAHRYNIGRFGKAMEFDGINDYVILPASNTLAPGPQATISVWVKSKTGYNSGARILTLHRTSAATTGFGLMIDANKFSVYASNGTTSGYLSSGVAVDTDWHHILATNDGSTLRIYVDGIERASRAGGFVTGTKSGYIGHFDGSSTIYAWKGLIDHAEVYNRAITPEEVSALYNLYNDSCNNCKNAKCGDGFWKTRNSTTGQFDAGISNEQCDDGNNSDNDYCAGDCMTITGSCGNAVIESGFFVSE